MKRRRSDNGRDNGRDTTTIQSWEEFYRTINSPLYPGYNMDPCYETHEKEIITYQQDGDDRHKVNFLYYSREYQTSLFRSFADHPTIRRISEIASTTIRDRNQIRDVQRSGSSNYQLDQLFTDTITISTEFRSLCVIFGLLPFCKNNEDLDVSILRLVDLTRQSGEWSYPEELIVSYGLALHLLSNYNSQLVDILRHEQSNEFKVIQRATYILLKGIGRKNIDRTLSLEVEEKEQACKIIRLTQPISLIPQPLIRRYYKFWSDYNEDIPYLGSGISFWFIFLLIDYFLPLGEQTGKSIMATIFLFGLYSTLEIILWTINNIARNLRKRETTKKTCKIQAVVVIMAEACIINNIINHGTDPVSPFHSSRSERETYLLTSFECIANNSNNNNRYVVPSYLLCVFGYRLYKINKSMLVPRDIDGESQVEQFATLLENNDTMKSTLQALYYICGNNDPMCKRLAHPRLVKALIDASRLVTLCRFTTVTTNIYSTNPKTRDKAIEQLFYDILTSDEKYNMFTISSLLPYLEIDDIPMDELMGYCELGFPIQILVAELLSKYLVSEYNNRRLSILYFNTPLLASMFLGLIWFEQKNECSVIKKAAVIMFNHVGKELIDNTDLLDDNEKMAAYSLLKEGWWTNNQLSKSINKILVKNELFVQDLTANTLIWFGCGMVCGWRQLGGGGGGAGSIKYIVGMGLGYAAAEITRSIVKYSIDERRKSNVNHLTTVLLAAISVPSSYMYISMLKISPIPVLLLHLGRYLYTTYQKGIQYRKVQTHLQNNELMDHYKQKIINVSSEFKGSKLEK
ncbi:hypothetical protein DFA_00253 [Cavenderia fasciculata]|uniref:Transmembrane protein n=1 Tax=Cavenderia fasciculata TaxID=261658 RepID=F4PY15_CACFS|nr:uncharacterized protein DFA_00253 [Cavenderia fasciculata]EGG19675.1 hypothetical protein DFA_00253 [Cavenderia fasciculata]|eukprot:XP_004357969.1 hypothetical protein DFA_00253 [Cavenderia fasciculata]